MINEFIQIIYSLYWEKEVTKKSIQQYTYFYKVIKQNGYYIYKSNSKTTDLHRLLLNLTGKMNLKKSNNYVTLSNLSIYYLWKNIKESYRNNKFKISAPTLNEEFELHDGSYSVSDIQEYFEYILKEHETVTDNPSIWIYVNKIETTSTFKIKKGYLSSF